MSMPLLAQGLVIALLVAWSALYAMRRLLPVTSRRLQARAAALLDRDGAPAALRTFARRATPQSVTGTSCGDGCSTCGACGTQKSPTDRAADADVQPLVFRPRSKR